MSAPLLLRHKGRTGLIPTLVMAWAAPALANGHALERTGNIFVQRPDGGQVQVTSSGTDSDPDLSLDGSKVVFVRKLGRERSEIWIAHVTRAAEPRPLVKTPLEVNGQNFNQVFTPRFSPDGAAVYFLIPYGAATQAILKVSVAKPDPQFIAAALNFRVIHSGLYHGNLVAQIRKAKLAPGYYEWYWLLTPDGKEIGIVGQDEGDVALFMEQQELK